VAEPRSPVDRPSPADRPTLADRLAVLCCRFGFWFPLLVCTYLALVPDPPDNPVFRLGDVILHGAAFTYLTFAFVLMAQARDGGGGLSRTLALKAFLAMLGYGIFLELVQSLVPERSAELKDLGVDLIGVIVGLLLAAVLARPVVTLLRGIIRSVMGVFGPRT